MGKPPLVIIKNPLKPWSPCWLDFGESYCPICKKGIIMDYPFEEFEKEFPDQESIDKFLIENGYNPKMVGDWGTKIVENTMLKADVMRLRELLWKSFIKTILTTLHLMNGLNI
jgi:hypothetical protein